MHTYNYVYVKGQILPENDAVVSIQERAFRLGDGVFETIRVSGGKPYLWDRHLERLQVGLRLLRIDAAEEVQRLPKIIRQLVSRNNVTEGILRISVSRGIGSEGYLPKAGLVPTCVVQVMPGFPTLPTEAGLWYTDTLHSYGLPCKSLQSLPYILARMEAQEHGCFEALLCHTAGWIAEASSANIFWVKNKTIYTPALELGIIGGIIRHRVIELSPYPVEEGKYTLADLQSADEVFITNVSGLVLPVASIQGNGFSWKFPTLRNLTRSVQDCIAADLAVT